MMKQLEIQTAIREFVQKQFPAARKRGISDHDSLLDNSIIDSMGVLEIVTFIESEFALTLSDDELLSDHFESIDSISKLIYHKTAEVQAWTS